MERLNSTRLAVHLRYHKLQDSTQIRLVLRTCLLVERTLYSFFFYLSLVHLGKF